MTALLYGTPSAAVYGNCQVCHAPRCTWTVIESGGDLPINTKGLCCSLDELHGPDVPPGHGPEPDQVAGLGPEAREALRDIVLEWIGEGFATPPYKPEVYDALEALGITGMSGPYDTTRPRVT